MQVRHFEFAARVPPTSWSFLGGVAFGPFSNCQPSRKVLERTPHLLVQIRSLGIVEICGKNHGGLMDSGKSWDVAEAQRPGIEKREGALLDPKRAKTFASIEGVCVWPETNSRN